MELERKLCLAHGHFLDLAIILVIIEHTELQCLKQGAWGKGLAHKQREMKVSWDWL